LLLVATPPKANHGQTRPPFKQTELLSLESGAFPEQWDPRNSRVRRAFRSSLFKYGRRSARPPFSIGPIRDIIKSGSSRMVKIAHLLVGIDEREAPSAREMPGNPPYNQRYT